MLRDLLQETHLSVNDFIYPLFVRGGEGIKNEVASMPDVFQMSIDEVLQRSVRCWKSLRNLTPLSSFGNP